MGTITSSNYAILSGLASQLGLRPVWSPSSGDALSDINGWLGYALSDSVRSPQLIALREQVRIILGSSVTPDAKRMFEYYRGLLDGIAPFPASVVPLAWFDGYRNAMFADAAGTIPVAIGGFARRANESSPLTHNWQTSASNLAKRDIGGLNIEPANGNPFSSASNASLLNENDYTIIVSWVPRDGAAQLFRVALPGTGAYPYAIIANGDGFYALPSAFTTIPGARHTFSARFTPTSVKAELWTNGIQTASTTLVMAVSGGNPSANDYIVGLAQNYFYGIVSQVGVVGRAVTDSENGQLITWANVQPAGPGYPLDKPLLITDGDSIVAGSPGPFPYDIWRYIVLRNIRSGIDAEMLSVANGGSGVAGHYSAAQPYLNTSRPKQIAVFAAGTNDINAGFPASVVLPIYLATLNSYRAAGCKVVAATIIDRVSSAFFDTERAAFNTGLRAAVGSYDALADAALVPQLGAVGAAANPAYFIGDGIHPNAAGHALMAPVYTAAIQAV